MAMKEEEKKLLLFVEQFLSLFYQTGRILVLVQTHMMTVVLVDDPVAETGSNPAGMELPG